MHRTLAASPQAAANKLRKSKAPAQSQSEPQRRSERIANSPAQSGWTRRSPLGSAIVKASAPVPSGRLAPARTCGVPGFPCRSQRCRGLCLRPLRFLRTATTWTHTPFLSTAPHACTRSIPRRTTERAERFRVGQHGEPLHSHGRLLLLPAAAAARSAARQVESQRVAGEGWRGAAARALSTTQVHAGCPAPGRPAASQDSQRLRLRRQRDNARLTISFSYLDDGTLQSPRNSHAQSCAHETTRNRGVCTACS